MNQVIAFVGKLDGQFYASTPEGVTRFLKTGDPIYQGEAVFSQNDNPEGKYIELIKTNGESLVYTDTSYVILDPSVTGNDRPDSSTRYENRPQATEQELAGRGSGERGHTGDQGDQQAAPSQMSTPSTPFHAGIIAPPQSEQTGWTDYSGTGDTPQQGQPPISVPVSTVQNTPPSTTGSEITGTEDTPYVFSKDNFNFYDADGDAFQTVMIDTLPGKGTLYINNIPVYAGQIISVGEIAAGHLTFVPEENDNGEDYTYFGYSVGDGNSYSGQGSMVVNITPVNDPTQFEVHDSSYTENSAASVLDASLVLSDPDTPIIQATVSIKNGFQPGDILSADTIGTSLSASYNAATGVLTITGSDTAEHYQSVLSGIKFYTASDDPTADTSAESRVIGWSVENGDGQNLAYDTTLTVTALTDAPVIEVEGAAHYNASGNHVTLLTSDSITDADDTNMSSAKIAISGGFTQGDVLTADTAGTSISASYDAATGVLTLQGTDTLEHYRDVMSTVTFYSTSDTPTALSPDRTVSWTVSDANSDNAGTGVSAEGQTTVNISENVTANQAADIVVTEKSYDGSDASVSGNLITDGSSQTTGVDFIPSDVTAKVYQIVYNDAAGDQHTVELTQTVTSIDTEYGTLTVNRDTGAYTYVVTSTFDQPDTNKLTDTFQYNLINTTENVVSNLASQNVVIMDGADPMITSPDSSVLAEASLPDGSAPSASALSQTGSLHVTGGSDTFDTHFTQDTLDYLESQGLKSGGTDVTYTMSPNGHMVTASAGSETVFTVSITDPTDDAAGYSVVLSGVIDSSSDTHLSVPFTVTDHDGDTAVSSIDITIEDDKPEAYQAADQNLDIKDALFVTGNLFADGTDHATGVDFIPQDGEARIYQVQYEDANGNLNTVTLTDTLTTLTMGHGELTINRDTGSYIFTGSESDKTGGTETFSYNFKDLADGDVSNFAPQNIIITPYIGAVVGTPDGVSLDEANLADGSAPDSSMLTQTGSLHVTPGTEDFDTKFTTGSTSYLDGLHLTTDNGVPLQYILSSDGHTITATDGSSTIFTLNITDYDNSGAGYSFSLAGTLDGASDIAMSVPFSVVSADDSVSSSFGVTVVQDLPKAYQAADQTMTEKSYDGSDTAVTGNLFTDGSDHASGVDFIPNGDNVKINQITYTDASGVQHTETLTQLTTTFSTEYGTLTVNRDTGDYTFTNTSPVDHADGDSVTETFQYNFIDLTGNVTSNTVSQNIIINDGADPAAGTPQSAVLSQDHLPDGNSPDAGELTQTGSLHVTGGSDTFDTVFTQNSIDYLAGQGLKSGGTDITYTLSADGHTITAEAGGNTVFTLSVTDGTTDGAGYSMTLSAGIDGTSDTHLSVPFTVTDYDGDSDSSAIDISIAEKGPVAYQAADVTLTETAYDGAAHDSHTGNLFNDGTDSATGKDYQPEGDQCVIYEIKYTDVSGNPQILTLTQNSTTVETQYGSLTVDRVTGDYTFVADKNLDQPADNKLTDTFEYSIKDIDNSGVSNFASQNIIVLDGADPFADAGDATVLSKANLAGGSAPDALLLTQTGSLHVTGGSDSFDTKFGQSTVDYLNGLHLKSSGQIITFTVSSDGHTVTGSSSAGTVITLNITDGTTENAGYSVTLSKTIDNSDDISLAVPFAVTDHDGDSVSSSLGITIHDDNPAAYQAADKDITETASGFSTTGNLLTDGTDSSTGKDFVPAGGKGQIYQVEYTGTDGILHTATLTQTTTTLTTEYGKLVINRDTGSYTFSSTTPLDQNDADGDKISTSFTYSFKDVYDGDISNTATQNIIIRDGADPSIGTAASGTLYEANLSNGSSPDSAALTHTGTLGVTGGSDAYNTQFTSETITYLNSLALESNKSVITYALSPDGHTITATAGTDTVFTLSVTNPTASAGYSFVLGSNFDKNGDVDFSLPYTVTDHDGDAVTGSLNITVIDDASPASVSIVATEDTLYKLTTNADVKQGSTDLTDPSHGSVVLNSDGSINYTPEHNFSGTDSFTYTTHTESGDVTTTVNIQVNPVSDAPAWTGTTAYTADEDTQIAMTDLPLPTITDSTGNSGAADGGFDEKLGYITLEKIPAGTVFGYEHNGTPETATVDSSGKLTIVIVNTDGSLNTNYHYTGLSTSGAGVIAMTEDEYQNTMTYKPVPDSSTDVSFEVHSTSYEVGSDGVPLTGVAGAESHDNVSVTVHAVTDDVSLALHDAGTTAAAGSEDTWINVGSLFDGTTGDYKDGSETQTFTITGVPAGWTYYATTSDAVPADSVQGQSISGGTFTVTLAKGYTFSDYHIYMKPPLNDHTDISGLTATLTSTDHEDDGSAVASQTATVSDFGITVAPVSDDPQLAVREVFTQEDSPVTMDIRPIVLSGETPLQVTIGNIPDGASFSSGGQIIYTNSTGTPATYTFTIGATTDTSLHTGTGGSSQVTLADLQTIQFVPPANSNEAITLAITPYSQDGAAAPDGVTYQVPVHIQGVADTPVVNISSSISGTEHTASSNVRTPLGVTATTADTDGSETITYTLSNIPTGVRITDGSGNLIGTFMGNGKWAFDSTEIADVHFETPVNFSGIISGLTLTTIVTENDGDSISTTNVFNLDIAPVVTTDSSIIGSATGNEDGLITLHFGGTADTSESVTEIRIPESGIPAGTALVIWNGTDWVAPSTSGSDYVIDGSYADGKIALQIAGSPMEQYAGTDYSIHGIQVDIIDATDTDPAGTLATVTVTGDMPIDITAVADAPHISAGSDTVSGACGDTVPLDLSAVYDDNDGSETHYFIIKNVPDGCTLNNANYNGDGTWYVAAADLANVSVHVSYAAQEGQVYHMTVDGYSVEALNGDTAISSTNIDFTVGDVSCTGPGTSYTPQTPDLAVQPQTVLEDTSSVVLGSFVTNAALTNSDGGTEVLSFIIKQVPEGMTLTSDDTSRANLVNYTDEDGNPAIRVFISGDAIDALNHVQITLPANFSGDTGFQLIAAATETGNGYPLTAYNTQDVTVHVDPVADALTASSLSSVNEDTLTQLTLSLGTADDNYNATTNPQETFSNIKLDISNGSFVVDGVKQTGTLSVNVNQSDGSVTTEDGKTVYILSDSQTTDTITINVTGDVTDTATVAGSVVSDTQTQTAAVSIGVNSVPDPAGVTDDSGKASVLSAAPDTGTEDTPVALNVIATFPDTDGSELHSLKISGITPGALIVDQNGNLVGQNNGDGTWKGSLEDVENGLYFLPPKDSSGDFSLSLTAYAIEQDTMAVGENTISFSVSVTPVADGVVITPHDASGTQGDFIHPDGGTTGFLEGALIETETYKQSPYYDSVNPDTSRMDELYKVVFTGTDSGMSFYYKDDGGEYHLLANESGTDGTYEINRLTQSQLDSLSFVSHDTAGNITLTAAVSSEEVNHSTNEIISTSDAQTAQVNITVAQTAQSEHLDSLSYDSGITHFGISSYSGTLHVTSTDDGTVINSDSASDIQVTASADDQAFDVTVYSDNGSDTTLLTNAHFGSSSDDSFVYSSHDAFIGFGGNDTLHLSDSIDLSSVSLNINGIETIDMADGKSNSMTNLTVQDLLNMKTDDGTLTIKGDTGDSVSLSGLDGAWTSHGTTTDGSGTYNVYSNDANTVQIHVDTHITTTITG